MTDDPGHGIMKYQAHKLQVNDVVTMFSVNDVLNVVN